MIDTLFKIVPGLEVPRYSLTTFFCKIVLTIVFFFFLYTRGENSSSARKNIDH